MNDESSLINKTAVAQAFGSTVLTECLKTEVLKKIPFLGVVISTAENYRAEIGAIRSKELVDQLNRRVTSAEEKLANITDGLNAENIEKIFAWACKERVTEKMDFYAGLIAGELLGISFDWEIELREQFNEKIAHLSVPEIMILKAMYDRKNGEVIAFSLKKGHWLIPEIKSSKTTLAWVDSLITNGLVVDASIEKLQEGFGNPCANSVKNRSGLKLSTYALAFQGYGTLFCIAVYVLKTFFAIDAYLACHAYQEL